MSTQSRGTAWSRGALLAAFLPASRSNRRSPSKPGSGMRRSRVERARFFRFDLEPFDAEEEPGGDGEDDDAPGGGATPEQRNWKSRWAASRCDGSARLHTAEHTRSTLQSGCDSSSPPAPTDFANADAGPFNSDEERFLLDPRLESRAASMLPCRQWPLPPASLPPTPASLPPLAVSRWPLIPNAAVLPDSLPIREREGLGLNDFVRGCVHGVVDSWI